MEPIELNHDHLRNVEKTENNSDGTNENHIHLHRKSSLSLNHELEEPLINNMSSENKISASQLENNEEPIVIRERKASLIGPGLEILCLFLLCTWAAITFVFYYLDNPPFSPRTSAYLLVYTIGGGFSIDVIFQTIVAYHKRQLCHGRYLFNILLHHMITIVVLIVPPIQDNEEIYKLFLACTLVELNTLFLRFRRILNRENMCYLIINCLFLFTWFLFRIIMWIGLLTYGWYLWRQDPVITNILLLPCILGIFMFGLYIMWTIALFNKCCYKNKHVMEAGIASLDEAEPIDRLTDPPLPDIPKNIRVVIKDIQERRRMSSHQENENRPKHEGTAAVSDPVENPALIEQDLTRSYDYQDILEEQIV